MAEVEFNKTNCFNIYFDTEGNVCYTRHINDKLYTYRTSEGLENGIVETLSALSEMCDNTFILICNLSKTNE